MSNFSLHRFRYILQLNETRTHFLYYNKVSISSSSFSKENKVSKQLIKDEINNKLDYNISASKEIKKFLKSNNMAFKKGYTSYICSCPRHIKRQLDIDQLDKLFINCTTG